MRAASDAEKQQLYETFIMLAGLMTARQAAAAADAAALKELRPLGAEALKLLLKTDPSKITINAEGLRLAGASPSCSGSTSGLHTLQFTAPPQWKRKIGVD